MDLEKKIMALPKEKVDKFKDYLSQFSHSAQETVKKNLELMFSQKPGGMAALGESFGGTGGEKGATYNFYYNPYPQLYCQDQVFAEGQILYFQNPQNVPEEIQTKASSGFFHLNLDLKNLIGYIDKVKARQPESRGAKVLAATAICYNILASQGF